MVVAHVIGVGVAAWLLAFGGLQAVGMTPGAPIRRGMVLACASVYLVRACATTFYLGYRKVSWTEGVGVGLWLATIHIWFALLAGSVTTPLSNLDVAGIELFGFGAFITTKSEIDRAGWKRMIENAGHLYTAGWFRLSRHINFLGEVILFSGYALLTQRSLAFAIPATMLMVFALVNVPLLDRHLARRYGMEFESYACRTKRLIPWVY